MDAHCVSRLHSAINKRDFLTLKELFSKQVIIDFPGCPLVCGGPQAVMFFRLLLGRFKYLSFDVVDILVSTDRACIVWKNAGEQPSGEKYVNRGVTLISFEGSKITLLSDYFKDTSFWIHKGKHVENNDMKVLERSPG